MPGGILDNNSKSQAIDNRIDNSGAEAFSAGAKGGTAARDNGFAIGSKAQLHTGADYSKLKLGVGSQFTVNQGTSEDTLLNLVGGITSATGNQINAIKETSSEQLTALTKLIGQKKETEEGSPKTFAWVSVVSIVATVIGIILVLRKAK